MMESNYCWDTIRDIRIALSERLWISKPLNFTRAAIWLMSERWMRTFDDIRLTAEMSYLNQPNDHDFDNIATVEWIVLTDISLADWAESFQRELAGRLLSIEVNGHFGSYILLHNMKLSWKYTASSDAGKWYAYKITATRARSRDIDYKLIDSVTETSRYFGSIELTNIEIHLRNNYDPDNFKFGYSRWGNSEIVWFTGNSINLLPGRYTLWVEHKLETRVLDIYNLNINNSTNNLTSNEENYITGDELTFVDEQAQFGENVTDSTNNSIPNENNYIMGDGFPLADEQAQFGN